MSEAPGALAVIIDRYLRHLAIERGLAANTLAAYRRDLDGYAEFLRVQGVETPEGIAPAHVSAYARHLGSRPEGAGWWVPPSVVTVDDPATRIWREEVFGPVVAVMPFDDEADAVAKANDTEYGLSGSIFTNDLGRGLRVARAVEAGNLSVNSHASVRYWTPFGGYKQSGLGRELGPDAPMAFTEEKNVFIAH